MPVVVAEREAEQARVERVAHVPLDREGLLPRDEPPAEHEERSQETDAEDHEDQEGQLVAVLSASELVDHEAREHDHRDRSRLREDGEDRRRDQRRAVGPQELQQPREGSGVRGGDQAMVGAGFSSTFSPSVPSPDLALVDHVLATCLAA